MIKELLRSAIHWHRYLQLNAYKSGRLVDAKYHEYQTLRLMKELEQQSCSLGQGRSFFNGSK